MAAALLTGHVPTPAFRDFKWLTRQQFLVSPRQPQSHSLDAFPLVLASFRAHEGSLTLVAEHMIVTPRVQEARQH